MPTYDVVTAVHYTRYVTISVETESQDAARDLVQDYDEVLEEHPNLTSSGDLVMDDHEVIEVIDADDPEITEAYSPS